MMIREVVEGYASNRDYVNSNVRAVSRSVTYWGVFCRTCQEPVAFDTPPYRASGLGGVHARLGAICCERGHSHVYFPRDFRFLSSETPISEATMEANRAAYHTAKAS